ncbi:MlaD family protein [Vibrio europaeus]|uniref:MlaD family protein n=1 Tax=Vibrio europaeus TaxID=300876 RepID=UPI0018A7BC5C|nr:MlaD family protein [Vibrio europaeus]MDC5806665.1 MlaD family protein [Vibrio europaeus]MDC5812982.1 MlaD family protein [Vibrio europaeus]MDC5824279.1 MlaD family protein [Vibrio europaeus]MDC5830034.1 MlaD family protein [Vibrio europaeus]MDC5836890.1 MlaD family protein [Vibrio europaeus]
MSNPSPTQNSYSPNIKRNKGLSPLWLLPILTMVLAGWLVFKAVQDAGQRVQIYFSDAQGLIAGRTTIRYQGLEVGMVKDINLAEDLQSIYVDADIYPEATKLLTKETRFWMVKPTASLSGISGLDALVSGNYIAISPSSNPSEPETEFTALERAPSDLMASEGLNISLKARDLGGISVGSQIVYRKIPIGEVYSYQLHSDSKHVVIQASIQDEYRHIITDDSRFWNVSGIGANIGFEGVDVRLESFSALIGGSIAVDSPDGGAPVADNSEFRLYPDIKTAGRGIAIKVELPDNNNISENGAPIMYRGIEIGQITDLELSNGRESIIAAAAIQPAFSDMLTTGSKFVLEEAKVSLSGVENIANIVKGNFLTIVPGEGNRSRKFSAVRKDEFNRQQARSVSVHLIADNSFGLDEGAHILYRGISVGSVTQVRLVNDKVQLDALVDSDYAHLIKSQNRFFVTGSASAELTESGLNISVPPAKQLLTGSISFVSEGKANALEEYRLYPSKSLAELAKYNMSGSTKLTMYANELPPISKGSPLLYRNLQVGNVADFYLVDGGVIISASIENQYKHLVTEQTVFWNRSGVEIDASLAGINVKAAPLKSLIQGGIAFDSLPGVDNKQNDKWLLYKDFKTARKFGQVITLTLEGENTLSKGTSINYNGVKVGEVTLVVPNFERKSVEVKARILPEYTDTIAVDGSYFWLPKAEVGLRGVKNIQNLLAQSISVQPGKGKTKNQFALHTHKKAIRGVTFTLQSESRGSISAGTPVLYRDIEVGEVTKVELGEFADRVVSTVVIDPNYAYLVRRNSVFWNTSGVDVSIGLTGANIKAGTFDSLVRGGITFSTPEQKQLEPIAEQGQSFYLYAKAEDGWKEWRAAIPKP